MGVLAPVSAHAGPSARPPIGTSGNLQNAKFLNCSTNPSGRNSPFWILSAQNWLFKGGREGSPIFFSPLESLYFCYLGAHAKFQKCSANPFGRNSPFQLLSTQNRLFWGAWGGPRNFFPLKSSFFCYLGAPIKFQNCNPNPSGRNGPFRLLSGFLYLCIIQ